MRHIQGASSCRCSNGKADRLPICCIVPPHMLEHLARSGNASQVQWALRTLILSAHFRGRREALGGIMTMAPAGTKQRTIYDARNTETLPGAPVRKEGDPASGDVAVNEAYDGSGATYDFYQKIFSRNSIDNHGMRLDSTVHYGMNYDNAFWNGTQMVYGDGDKQIFNRFTIAVDVIGHELTHGVTENTAALEYQGEPGALNESFSDVFGSMIKQWQLNQTALQADWLIGAGLFRPNIQGTALRSMENPGTAYNDPIIGQDPQPADMTGFYRGGDDNGGVHINSGIPNRAFCLAAKAMKGNSWQTVGPVWYQTLTTRLHQQSTFAEAADATIKVAADLAGANSSLAKAITQAWRTVKVIKPSSGGNGKAAGRLNVAASRGLFESAKRKRPMARSAR
ncbi:MAG TPA: M4 family metallopeptidase [Tepidisphaeraceae bacterium]|nr:M4 family metallopeptidase [Tepidisphaeraceae bacterium]